MEAYMNTKIKAVDFSLSDESREYIEKKITRLRNVENLIVDLLFTLTKEKNFSVEVKVNFRWGVSIFQKEEDFELNPAIDKLMDKLDAKIAKEREKVKEKR